MDITIPRLNFKIRIRHYILIITMVSCPCSPPNSLPNRLCTVKSSPNPDLSTIQLLLNLLLERRRRLSAGPPRLNLAILSNKEFLKIPLDALEPHPRLLTLQPLKHGLSVVSIDVYFPHDGETDAVVYLAEGLDFVVGAGVLGAELVAGESEDFETVGVFGFELL